MSKVKLFFLACITCALTVSVYATGFGMDVPAGTSVKVAPERGTVRATPWVEGMAVTQGQLVQRGRAVYMAVTNLVVSNTVSVADSGSFRPLLNNRPRDFLVLCNTGTTVLWLGVGVPAEAGKGIQLLEESAMILSDNNAAIYAVAGGAGGKVSGSDVTR